MSLVAPVIEREETTFTPIWAASGCWQQGEPADFNHFYECSRVNYFGLSNWKIRIYVHCFDQKLN